jgi:hypothetical protein
MFDDLDLGDGTLDLLLEESFGSIASTLGQPPGFGPALGPAAAQHAHQAVVASAWGQPNTAMWQADLGSRRVFEARALGQSVPDSAWRALAYSRPGAFPPSRTAYEAPWSPLSEGSGVRGDAESVADAIVSNMGLGGDEDDEVFGLILSEGRHFRVGPRHTGGPISTEGRHIRLAPGADPDEVLRSMGLDGSMAYGGLFQGISRDLVFGPVASPAEQDELRRQEAREGHTFSSFGVDVERGPLASWDDVVVGAVKAMTTWDGVKPSRGRYVLAVVRSPSGAFYEGPETDPSPAVIRALRAWGLDVVPVSETRPSNDPVTRAYLDKAGRKREVVRVSPVRITNDTALVEASLVSGPLAANAQELDLVKRDGQWISTGGRMTMIS